MGLVAWLLKKRPPSRAKIRPRFCQRGNGIVRAETAGCRALNVAEMAMG